MDLSIVIVNWNTEALLRDCLSSIFRSKPACPFEILIVDNGSNDGSRDMVRREFPQVKLMAQEKNLGFARANNVGFKACSGRYILMLNSDTLVHRDVLTRAVRYLENTPAAGAMGCRVINPDGSHQPSAGCFPSQRFLVAQTLGLSRALPYTFKRAPDQTATVVDTLSGCFLMMRRSALDAVGPLDPSFYFFGEETDWCRRAQNAGFELHYAPVGEITHFGGGSSGPLSFRRDLMLTNATVRLHRKHESLFAAWLVYAHLLVFNLSRSVFWACLNAFGPTPSRARRSDHFAKVVAHYREAWPVHQGAKS